MAKRKAAMASGRTLTGEPTTEPKLRRGPEGRTVQPRVFRRVGRLAQDALAALDAGNLDEVRQYLQSIQAVARSADGQ